MKGFFLGNEPTRCSHHHLLTVLVLAPDIQHQSDLFTLDCLLPDCALDGYHVIRPGRPDDSQGKGASKIAKAEKFNQQLPEILHDLAGKDQGLIDPPILGYGVVIVPIPDSRPLAPVQAHLVQRYLLDDGFQLKADFDILAGGDFHRLEGRRVGPNGIHILPLPV